MAHTIVIFGASGDLTSRKLIPALYELDRKGRLPRPTRIVGFARTGFSHQAWRQRLEESTARFVGERFDRAAWDAFAPSLFYHPGDIERPESFSALDRFLTELEGAGRTTRIYYLATAPQFYRLAVLHLGMAGMADEGRGPRRVVIEKPFGVDRASACELNRMVHQVFAESQVYRIDHYLGKETVQNLLVLRFANAIFEPIWNRNYIDFVEITAAESLTVGHRGSYYDAAGVLRDMFQNHLLQQLTLTAMEAPARLEADFIRDEKVKVLRSIRPMRPDQVVRNTLRGQYRGYLQEPGVAASSRTATFAVVKLGIDNWRWQGVPFYLRSGKAMSCPTTQIVIQFRQPPHLLFEGRSARGAGWGTAEWGPETEGGPSGCLDAESRSPDVRPSSSVPGRPSPVSGSQLSDASPLPPVPAPREANRLVIQIQPAEGIQLHFHTKVPDAGMQLRLTDLSFRFSEKFSGGMPDAYQRLLLDVMQGDASLFARADEVELAWGIIDPIQATWDDRNEPELLVYEPGAWGPELSTHWMLAQGHQWFDSCPVLH